MVRQAFARLSITSRVVAKRMETAYPPAGRRTGRTSSALPRVNLAIREPSTSICRTSGEPSMPVQPSRLWKRTVRYRSTTPVTVFRHISGSSSKDLDCSSGIALRRPFSTLPSTL
ncbi:MAG: hypothetical protein AO394_02325 [Candidatus Fermentibacter daniensis]|nr:MAG: hypothetical protein AO394_02325 [Candidatus Fermentibacter daniensis]